jgi:hypothetical protein
VARFAGVDAADGDDRFPSLRFAVRFVNQPSRVGEQPVVAARGRFLMFSAELMMAPMIRRPSV